MANTTNLDLVKPAGTDQALISVLNGNSDKIDQFAGNTNTSLVSLADGLAIVANGDTHAAIESGQYVYVRNHTTLAEGLYTATSAIAANASLSTSNLTADSDGGLNSAIAKLAKTISSGSLHDIVSSGLYYLTNAVTDKPTSTGGYYSVSTNGSVVSGIFIQNSTGASYSVTYNGTTWTYQQLATKSDLGGARMEYFTVSPNTSTTLNYSYVAFIVVGRNGRAFEGFVTYEGTVISFHTNESITISAVGNSTVTIANGTITAMHGLMITKS